MNVYGLIGYPLSHSFSKKYFTEKFAKEGIKDCVYENYELKTIDLFPGLIQSQENLRGLNVTIPYKQDVIPFLSSLDISAERVGAVNVIKVMQDGRLIGFNSDYYGFRESLLKFLPENHASMKALVLGTGGASKAVIAALEEMDIVAQYVSRTAKEGVWAYSDIDVSVLTNHQIVINTTPLGMSPKIDAAPDLPYEALTENHYLFDLVYNPEETLFMKKGLEQGANVKNGLEMLHLQAEKAWEIWRA